MRIWKYVAALIFGLVSLVGTSEVAHASTFMGYSYAPLQTPNRPIAVHCVPYAVSSGGSNLTCSYGGGRYASRWVTRKDSTIDGRCQHGTEIGSAYTYFGTVQFTVLAFQFYYWTPCAY